MIINMFGEGQTRLILDAGIVPWRNLLHMQFCCRTVVIGARDLAFEDPSLGYAYFRGETFQSSPQFL